jgi:ankyrin repeat protein
MPFTRCATLLIALALPLHAQAGPDAALFAAIDREDIPALRAALAAGASLQAYDTVGHLPLVAAAAQGNAKLFRVLLDAGADIDAKDRNQNSAITQAAFDNQIDVLRVLLPRHPNLNAQDATGNTALFYAVNHANFDIIHLLLNAGADLAVTNHQGHTVLSQAYIDNDIYEVVSTLRSAGATFANPTDELYANASTGDIEGMRHALDAGADPNTKPRYGLTALGVAAKKGNTVAVRLLLKRRADTRLDDGNQQPPLFWALVSRHRSTVDALLNAGADPLALTPGHRTLLVTAAYYFDDPDLLARFLLAGVDPNRADDSYHQTSLMVAAQAGHADSVKYLLTHGADPTRRDKDNKAAADFAHAYHEDNLAALLARAELDWDAKHR